MSYVKTLSGTASKYCCENCVYAVEEETEYKKHLFCILTLKFKTSDDYCWRFQQRRDYEKDVD